MHIYSDIWFVQSIVMIITMSLRFRENMRMSLQKVCCKYATLALLAAWTTKLLFTFWMENIQQRKRAKCASLKSCHSFQFIAISNSAIINESVNTAQLISYLHHLYTLFIIIRGLASRASRTLDWTRTLAFWAVSGFWLTKTPLIGHCVIEINRYVSDLLQCTTLQKQSANTNTHLILTWGGCRLLSFCCLCLFSCFFPESWTWLHTYVFLKSSWRPIFSVSRPTRGLRPRVWKPLSQSIKSRSNLNIYHDCTVPLGLLA